MTLTNILLILILIALIGILIGLLLLIDDIKKWIKWAIKNLPRGGFDRSE